MIQTARTRDNAEDRVFRYYVLALTGARKGEALNLHWRDIDFERGVVTIKNAVKGSSGSGKPMRTDPLSNELAHALKARKGDRDKPL